MDLNNFTKHFDVSCFVTFIEKCKNTTIIRITFVALVIKNKIFSHDSALIGCC